MKFDRFAAIDWSGAAGARQKGIALATCVAGEDAPELVRPGHIWSRREVLDWMLALEGDWLIGLDLSPSLAFADKGAFFPGWARSPADVRGLWALVEDIASDEPHLGANRFVDHPEASRHFRRHGGRCGDLFPPGAGRFRVVEDASREQGLCNPYSNFNLVGAAQVGKSSLTGMRLFHRIGGKLPIWPYDPVPERGPVVIEIYTSIAATAAGLPRGRTKIRDPQTLDRALAALGSRAHAPLGRYDDHATDALLAAAWLRAVAHDRALWSPAKLTPELARTEGWTFGVR
ncbi:hypothetical protein GON01_05130 [Sphingomonas sp. MAH-20]|uniref:DUF429 domain-containing protein n=1 Tax=Sphingomonas horti TaxID=2682842 RepID=A0A6I4IYJ9_9SPHN|nr:MULTISPECIES: hypothetical protein [Sphingomonas]MBA2918353.1 hypothetical protein [Sphingomonas sp. CGMCC 1.13658]MVO77320.1 hypothetical protein [Sphingomonas horti]